MDQNQQAAEQEIDLLELAKKLWQRRKTFYKAFGIAVVVALVIAFSLPKQYGVTVTLSPESGENSTGGNLGGIASMIGVNLGGSETDALNITLFPDILSSNPFALELYGMPVTVEDGEETTSMPLNEYMESQSKPWWGWLMSLPGKAVGGILSLFKDEEEGSAALNPFRLSKEETLKLEAIKHSMSATVDKKTGITTITVTLQDPLVAATVADSVVRKLQDYVTDYRTRKAIDDCAYWEKLYTERQSEYYTAQQKYAAYVDENKGLYTQKSKVEGDRLQNDMNLAYQVYSQTAQQLQLTRGKIQEAKPVFAVVNPATVPIKAASPKKLMILVGFVFLAFCGTAGWILFGEDIWGKLRIKN
ncbi:chain-length determining protein [Mediterranea sp. An20]|uniref:Wzz/FepE/Etk N-terminal domain-containing protein n=1 Tax=Mediterranea sp. An20 TaxID=1965586 RepID=UPI000B385DE8|nr:Wzz/FepE/Etk N-terminal domain-containing protein [Mediterranea sp. An20]OUP07249.1 chain-length determining protein [Mediterranea sp. An20]